MSPKPIAHSEDLRRLRDEGFDIEVRAAYLVMRDVPYVTPSGMIARGILADPLRLTDDCTEPPGDHTMLWAGETPCNPAGQPLGLFDNSASALQIDSHLTMTHRFSAKPATPDANYYDKYTRYLRLISSPAQKLDPSVTAATFPVVIPDDEDTVFLYLDTASSRAHVTALADKLRQDRIAIVGLGGTGAYILDLVAKTEVREIHLFDADTLHQHNAFRAPGAPSRDDLRRKPSKVEYYRDLYSNMRTGVIAHRCNLDESNAAELAGMNFAFLSSRGTEKRGLVKALECMDIPFIDVGMDVFEKNGGLAGVLRVTTSTPKQRSHVWERRRIPFSDEQLHDEYATNIQVADLNALNATLAVVKWKKLRGFYHDLQHEHQARYTIDDNGIVNEDCL